MKITKILAIASLFSLAAVGSAFATEDAKFNDSGTVTFGAPSIGVKPSKNVEVKYWSGAAITGNANGAVSYSVSASHSSGSKTFASSSGDTKIFMMDGTNGDAPSAPEAGGASAAFTTGWTAL